MKNTFTSAKLFMLAAACSVMFVNNSIAQAPQQEEKHCGTDIMLQQLYSQYPGLQQEAEQKQAATLEGGRRFQQNNNNEDRDFSTPDYIIPVVFHIIHDYGVENISDAQILDQMMILNRDYRMNNADTATIYQSFDTIRADTKIEFRLAQIDPNGNCTNGIDRIASMETYVGNDGAKLNAWPREKYLNVWVVKSMAAGVAGYAYMPSTTDGFLYPLDGINILHDYVGSIGTGAVGRSRALTHEIGHWLALPHVWGGTNQPGVACGDDGILDTPETKGFTTCPTPQAAKICDTSVVENYENYMDYSYCSKMFTAGQAAVMQYSLNSSTSSRNNLWTAANLAATGCLNVQPTCVPHADFSANDRMICEGNSVQFFDESWTSSATSWSWTLTGPTTLTSSAQNPTFSNMTSTGWYNVQLIATNSAGSDTITRNNYLLVSTDVATFTEMYSEGFEQPNTFALGYVSNNRYGNGSYFFQANWAGHTGTGSAVLNNFGNTLKGDFDELITPSYYLDNLLGAQMQFSYAYATAATSADLNTCTLKVYSSIDCGATWNQRFVRSGQNLATAGYAGNFFVPTANSSHWETVTINLPASVLTPNVRFKFEFESPEDGTGNNLYIDDINILGTNVGMTENGNDAGFSLYPNPTDGNSTINYTLTEQTSVKADLYDVSGRLVRNIYTGEQQAGHYNLAVCDEPLAPGTYMIQMTIGDKVSTRQLIVTGN